MPQVPATGSVAGQPDAAMQRDLAQSESKPLLNEARTRRGAYDQATPGSNPTMHAHAAIRAEVVDKLDAAEVRITSGVLDDVALNGR